MNYLTPEGDAVGQAIFEIDGVGDDTATCQGNRSISGNTVYFQDPPGTVITVPVSDPTGTGRGVAEPVRTEHGELLFQGNVGR